MHRPNAPAERSFAYNWMCESPCGIFTLITSSSDLPCFSTMKSAIDILALVTSSSVLFCALFLSVRWLLQQGQKEPVVTKVKRSSTKSIKHERRRQRARERQRAGKHHQTNTNAFYDAVTAVFNKRNKNQYPSFDTIFLQTMAHFTHCQPPTTTPTLATKTACYWNVDDEYVVRSSRLWSNDGRVLYPNTPCCWVLEPAYYDKHKQSGQCVAGKCRYDEMDFYAMFHVHFGNFFKNTTATYTKCNRPDREPDVTSPSGSEYWETPTGVIRCSDHWSNTCGRIATCWWMYEPDKETRRSLFRYQCAQAHRQRLAGYCPYENFAVKSEKKTLWRYAKQFLSKNIKDRKLLRHRQARTGVILDHYNRKLVNFRMLPNMLFQPKNQRNLQEQEDQSQHEGFRLGILKALYSWIYFVTDCWWMSSRQLRPRRLDQP